MKLNLKKVFIYTGYIIISTVIVFWTGFNGERIETRGELANAFPMKTGFPLNFAELRYPRIDPPLPSYYGGDCCSFFLTSWANFWLSVMMVFVFLVSITEIMLRLIKK